MNGSALAKRVSFIIVSFVIVAFAQPAWISWLGPIAAMAGYAFFWKAAQSFHSSFRVFILSVLWFAAVQLVQLSWMTSIKYQGFYILVLYGFLALALGVQFGLLSLVVLSKASLKFSKICAVAALWTLLEWSRFFVLCGFSFNCVGLSLTSYSTSMQFAGVFGVLGLSFFVIFTNLLLLAAWNTPKSLMRWTSFAASACFPYLFGHFYISYQESHKEQSPHALHIALVQPGMLPSQKIPLKPYLSEFVPLFDQWKLLLRSLSPLQHKPVDLVALPEAVVPLSEDVPLYPLQTVLQVFEDEKFVIHDQQLPPLKPPYAMRRDGVWFVSNAFWAQLISNCLMSDVIAGFDTQERATKKNYNSAFFFKPYATKMDRYDKRILLPLAEYIPWNFLKVFTKSYGIVDFFTQGKEAKVFLSKLPIGVTICYEEMFSEIVRESVHKGSYLQLNLTNDGWYPNSKLALQHFTHSKIRAVETGSFLLRACNTGVTAIVDPMGRQVATLGHDEKSFQISSGILYEEITPFRNKTLYLLWGDAGIIALSLLMIVWYLRPREEGLVF